MVNTFIFFAIYKNLNSIGVSDRMGGQGRYWWAEAVMVGRGGK